MGDICKSGVHDSGRDSCNGGWTVEVQKSKFLPHVYIYIYIYIYIFHPKL